MKNSIVMAACMATCSMPLSALQTQYQVRMQKLRQKVAPVKIFSEKNIEMFEERYAQQREQNRRLALAIETGNFSAVSEALERQANPHICDDNTGFPLWIFLFQFFPPTTRNVILSRIDTSVDIGAVNSNGMTILMYAAQHDNVELAQFVMRRGADLNVIDFQGATAFWYAVYKKSYGVIAALLNNPQLDAQITNYAGMTPLEWAASRAKSDPLLVALLASKAAQEEQESALRIARLRSNSQAILILSQLKKKGSKEAAQDSRAPLSPESASDISSDGSEDRSDSLHVEEWSGLIKEPFTCELPSAFDKDFISIKSEHVTPLPNALP